MWTNTYDLGRIWGKQQRRGWLSLLLNARPVKDHRRPRALLELPGNVSQVGGLTVTNHTGLAIKSIWFLSKNKTHFSFLPVTLLNNIFTILFHYLLPSFRQVHSPTFLTFWPFWAKNCPRCLLQSSRELKFLPLREFCKDWNKWKSKVQCLVNTVNESELSSQAVTVVAWSSEKHVVSCYPDGRWCIFCWLIPDTLHQVLLSVGRTGSSTCWN